MSNTTTQVLSLVLFLAIAGDVSANTVIVTTSKNWSALTGGSGAGGLPNASDTVIVENNASLSVDANTDACGNLQLGGSSGGSGNGTLVFINTSATLLVDNGAPATGTLTIGVSGGGTGSIKMSSGGSLYADIITAGNAGTWVPAPTPTGALIQIGAGTLSAAASSFFNPFNNLTIAGGDKTDPVDGTALSGPLVVSGNLEVLSYCQLIDAGGYSISVGGNLSFDGTGGGPNPNFTCGSGTVTLNGSSAQAVSNLDPTSAFYNLTINNSGGGVSWTGATAINGTMTLTSGNLSGSSALGLPNGATIYRAAGSLSQAPVFGTTVNVTYTGSTAVTAGAEIPTSTIKLNVLSINNSGGVTLGSGPTVNGLLTIANNSILNISGSGVVGGLILDCALTNAGTVNWLGGNIFLGSCSSGPVVNLTNALWTIQCAAPQSLSSGCGNASAYFTNAGTVFQTNTTVLNTISLPFYSSGTVDASEGSIGLADGGNLGGTYVAAANAAVDFDGGSWSLVSGSPSSSGAGQVQFTAGSTVSFSGSITNFTMAGGTLTGNNTVTGVLNWQGGMITGPLNVASNATLNISGVGLAMESVLTNAGTVNWLGGNVYLNDCGSGFAAGPIVNLPGCLWTIQGSSSTMSDNNCGNANAYFANLGTVLQTNTTGTNAFLIPFYNSGTVDSAQGAIGLGNGGTPGGMFEAALGAAINFDGGSWSLVSGAPSSSGAGQVQFTPGATVSFSGSITNFSMAGGTLSGNNVVTGVLNWDGGTVVGALTIASNATLNISGAGMAGGMAMESVLTNAGTVNWLGGNIYLSCAIGNPGPVVNLAGAQWTIQGQQQSVSAGCADANAYFTNAGTVLQTNTTGTNTISIPFYNSSLATLEAQQGTIGLADGGTLGGTFFAAAGAAIDFDGGTFPLVSGPPHTSGLGQVQFTSGSTVTFSGPITNFTMTGGAVGGNNMVTGVLNWTGGSVVGPLTIASSGTLNISGVGLAVDSVLTNAGIVNWLGGLVYFDTCSYGYAAGPVVNLTNSQWNILCDQTMSYGCQPDNAYFTNAGTVLKTNSTGTNTILVPFYNSGTLQAAQGSLSITNGGTLGGMFVAAPGSGIYFDGGNFPLASAAPASSGQVQFGLGATVTFSQPMTGVMNCTGATISGPLTIASNGTLNISGIGLPMYGPLTNAGTVNWLGGAVFLNTCSPVNGGPIVNLPGGLWNIQCDGTMSDNCGVANAYFTNAGTVLKTNTTGGTTTDSMPFYNSGTVAVGPGTIFFQSTYSDTASADILIALGGSTPNSGYGQIQFNDQPTFAGTLSATTQNGFQPTASEVFNNVFIYPSFAGVFSTTNLNLGDGFVLQPQFNSGSLTLTAAAGSQPQLSISVSGSSATIQWSSAFSSWVLQSTTNLVAPNWKPVSTNSDQTIVPVTGTQQYFRLWNGG